MALDSGDISGHADAEPALDVVASLRPAPIYLDEAGHVGQALRAARRKLGLAPEDIAQVTRVRVRHIEAIEDFRFSDLPARPFVVGYVRAYAQALGVNAETVVRRFHAEAPPIEARLGEPGGLAHDRLGPVRWLLLATGLVVTAVVGWNIARRLEIRPPPPPAAAPRPANAAADSGPAQLGAPLPTPPEASTPPAYHTPGLPGAETVDPVGDSPPIGSVFAPRGGMLGAPAQSASVILQARRPTYLIVRDTTGRVKLARMLGAGDAWAALPGEGGSVEAGDPAGVDVYVGGVLRARLLAGRVAVSGLERGTD